MLNKTKETHTWRLVYEYHPYGQKCKVCGIIYWDYSFNGYLYNEIYCDNNGNKLLK